MQHLGLGAAGAVHHAVDLRPQLVEQPFHHRGVGTRWREHQSAGVDGGALHRVGACPQLVKQDQGLTGSVRRYDPLYTSSSGTAWS